MPGSLAEYIDGVACDASDCHDVSTAIRIDNRVHDFPELVHILVGLDFFRASGGGSRLDRQPFGPLSSSGTSRYPPPLEELTEEVVAWSRVGQEVTDPLVKSRLCHLVWAAGIADSYICAKQAVPAYLALLGRTTREEVYRSYDLGYALDIALSLGEEDLVGTCILRSLDWLNELFEADEHSPGAVFSVLTYLASLSPQRRPDGLDEFCERAVAIFQGDPWYQENISDIQITLHPPQERESYVRRSIEAWISAADQSQGLIRSEHLRRALEQARNHGLPSEVSRILLLIQNLDLRGDLQEISGPIAMATNEIEEVEHWLEGFLTFEDWRDALVAFGRHCPISENMNQATASAENLLEQGPFYQFTSTTQVSEQDGVPSAFIVSGEEHLAAEVASIGRTNIQIWGGMASLLLDRMLTRWDPDTVEVVEFYECQTVSRPAARGFALGLSHYSKGDWESALMVTLPRIEESLRDMARHHGFSIQVSRSNRIEKRNSREHIENLSTLGDEPFFRYLNLLLVNQLAINLRNRALHGLMDHASQEEAALALHVATCLRVRSPDAEGLGSE